MLDSGQVEQAIPLLEALYVQDPATPDLAPTLARAYVTRGQDALARDDLDASGTAFDKALVVRSDEEAAQVGRRRVLARRAWMQVDAAWGKDDEAVLKALEQVRSNDPEYRSADVKDKLYVVRLGRADNLTKDGNGEAAVEELQRAIEVDPGRPEARMRLQALTPTPVPVPPTATPRPYVPPPAAAPASRPQQQAPAAQPAQPARQPASQPAPAPAPAPAAPAPAPAPKTNRPPPGSESPL
jgi:tetratricopeptide (TPR) repeat protein